MRQHLDTIPLWDAFKTECECPLCHVRAINEENYVDNFLGGSVMEPDVRIEVNQKGFCDRHFKMLFDAKNRLGLALMGHTYLKETIARVRQNAQRAKEEASGAARNPLNRLRGKNLSAGEEAARLASGCILCDRLNNTMYRYALTLAYMWKTEADFRRVFEQSKGFCLPHYAQLIAVAPEELSGKDLTGFIDALTALEEKNLARLEKEIEWFTLKFDYRNADKPWGASQDAVERTLNKLRGHCVP